MTQRLPLAVTFLLLCGGMAGWAEPSNVSDQISKARKIAGVEQTVVPRLEITKVHFPEGPKKCVVEFVKADHSSIALTDVLVLFDHRSGIPTSLTTSKMKDQGKVEFPNDEDLAVSKILYVAGVIDSPNGRAVSELSKGVLVSFPSTKLPYLSVNVIPAATDEFSLTWEYPEIADLDRFEIHYKGKTNTCDRTSRAETVRNVYGKFSVMLRAVTTHGVISDSFSYDLDIESSVPILDLALSGNTLTWESSGIPRFRSFYVMSGTNQLGQLKLLDPPFDVTGKPGPFRLVTVKDAIQSNEVSR